jgi:serine/threonine-protein phosphatase 2A regulatory subunit A
VELCKPLQLICAADENVVRDKAQDALLKVCEMLDRNLVETEFFELVEKLSKGDLYSMRIASCYLLSKTYDRTQLPQIRDQLFEELTKDDTPMVRRALAINLGKIAESIKYPIDTVLETFKKFLEDKQDAVRIEALRSSCTLAKLIREEGGDSTITEEKSQKLESEILKPIIKASEDKTSWRLRFTVAELLADLTHIVDKSLADIHIKPIVEALLNDSEPEVRSEIIIKVTEIVEFVKPDLVLDKLIALKTDASQHVRESLAE